MTGDIKIGLKLTADNSHKSMKAIALIMQVNFSNYKHTFKMNHKILFQ